MERPKLFMLLLGCKPKNRNIEQHDIFFSIGNTIKDLIPEMMEFWPEAGTKIHVDAWREVTYVNGYSIIIIPREEALTQSKEQQHKLFFINLGGYKPNEFDELHYKVLTVANEKGAAIKSAMQTSFYKHTGFEGATSHIDDKYGVDVDDSYEISELLLPTIKQRYSIAITESNTSEKEDEIHLGYFNLSKIKAL